MLLPTDLYICLYLSIVMSIDDCESLAAHTEVAVGTAHNTVKRLRSSGLIVGTATVNKMALLDLIIYGARYVYYVKPGTSSRGIPTADAAPPLASIISPGESPYVWPDPEGSVRGLAIEPLHKGAPSVARVENVRPHGRSCTNGRTSGSCEPLSTPTVPLPNPMSQSVLSSS